MKRAILFIFLCLGLFSTAVFAVLPQPVLYIPFNSDWDCQTAGGNETPQYALYKNRVPFSDEGVWGNALRFNPDGHYSAGGSLYYQDGGYADAVLDSGLEQFTICGWFKADSPVISSGTTILTRVANGGTAGPGYIRIVFDSFGRTRLIVNAVAEDQWHWFATEDTWTFFAVTYDGSASVDNVTWYYGTDTNPSYLQDGHTAVFGSLDGGTLASSDQPLVIGDDGTTGVHTFDGSMDEIRIFNQVLTAQQVEEARQLINAPQPSDPLYEIVPIPEPLVYIPGEGTYENLGSASGNDISVLSGYDEATDTLTGPGFASGILGQCIDLSMRNSHLDFEGNGGIRYEDNNDPNAPMKAALNGLRSFTVCGWIKVDEGKFGNGSTLFFFQRRDGQPYEYKMRFMTDTFGRPRSVLNHVWGPWTPYEWWGILPEDGWHFKAYTYNADDFGQEEKWYYATPTLNGTLRTPRSQPAGLLENSNEPIMLFPSFDGFADEVYLFGSKTDSSGALSLEQIQAIAAKVHQKFVCGTEGYPIPVGDTNGDCVVDMLDVANVGSNWMGNQ